MRRLIIFILVATYIAANAITLEEARQSGLDLGTSYKNSASTVIIPNPIFKSNYNKIFY